MTERTKANGAKVRGKVGKQRPTVKAGPDRIKELADGLDREAKKALATDLVRDILPDEAKKVAVAEAVKAAPAAVENDIAAEAVRVASSDAKKAAVAAAVETAPNVNKQDLAAEAMKSLPSDEARRAVAREFLPSQAIADKIWLTVVQAFQWVLWGATVALVGAIGVSLFREVDQAYVQILLTVFTTVAGIFAGFISGKALGTTTGR